MCSDDVYSKPVFNGFKELVHLDSTIRAKIKLCVSTLCMVNSFKSLLIWQGVGMGVVLYPDYIDYHGTHYLDSVVSFSRSYVEARSKGIYGGDESFHIHLEIEDIVKIESQWSAQVCNCCCDRIFFYVLHIKCGN